MTSYTMVCIIDDTIIVSLELFHNNTPTASVSNYCGFHYTSRQNITFIPTTIWEYLFFLTQHEAYDTLQKLQDILNSIPVIYIWTGLLPKLLGYVNYVRVSFYLYTHWAFNSWSIWNHVHLIDLISVPETLKFSNLLPLTIWAGVGLFVSILYFFRIFFKYAFAIVLIPHFLPSRWISIPRTNDASPRSFTLKLEDKTSSPMID